MGEYPFEWSVLHWDQLQIPKIPIRQRGAFWAANPNAFVLTIPKLGACLVESGQTARVALHPQAPAADPRILLQGLPLGALFIQRGNLVIRGIAIKVPRGAIVITGDTLSGKSTLGAALAQRGVPIIADEVCPMAYRNSTIEVLPGMPDLELSAEAAKRLEIPPGELSGTRAGISRFYWNSAPSHRDVAPLLGIYILGLNRNEEIAIEALSGYQRALRPSVYVLNVSLQGCDPCWSVNSPALVDIFSRIPIFDLLRPPGSWSVGDLAEALELHYQSLCAV